MTIRSLFAVPVCALALLGPGCGEELGDAPAVPLAPTDPVAMRREHTRRLAPLEATRELGPLESVPDGRARPTANAVFTNADRRHWSEESVAHRITAFEIQLLREHLVGAHPAERLADLFAEGAELAPPGPPVAWIGAEGSPAREVLAPGLERETIAPWEATLGPTAWLDAVRAWRGRVEAVRYATIVPIEIRIDGTVATLRLRWKVAVRGPGGARACDEAVWTSVWRQEDAVDALQRVRWRCLSLAPESATERLVSSGPWFADATLEAFAGSSLDPRLPRDERHQQRGLALADLDRDGDLDLVTTAPLGLFANRGDGTFEEVGQVLGVTPDEDAVGRAVADFDGDGEADVLTAGLSLRARVWLQRDSRYAPATIPESREGSRARSVTAADVDLDGLLDVFVAGYGDFSTQSPDDPRNGRNAASNQMLRGLAGARFERVEEAWGLAEEATRWTFIGAFGDADEDGDLDLYAANDFGPNVLYRRVEGDAVRFRAEVEPESEILPGFSMSAWWADLDGDLDLDMYVSNMESPDAERVLALAGNPREAEEVRDLRRVTSLGNTLLRNDGGRLVDASVGSGARDAGWAWGTALFDGDLDGDLDVQCVNGWIDSGVDDGRDWDGFWWRHGLKVMHLAPQEWPRLTAMFQQNRGHGWSWAGFQRSVFYLNRGSGRFVDVAPVVGLDSVSSGRGTALGDVDGDGDPDLVGSAYAEPHLYVLRNESAVPGASVVVEPIPSGGRSPAGTRLVVHAGGRALRRDVTLGAGFLSQHELAQHFGLGGAERVDRLEVRWPDGTVEVHEDLSAGARLRVRQGESDLERVPFAPPATAPLGGVEWDDARAGIRHPPEGAAIDLAWLAPRGAGGAPIDLRPGATDPTHVLVVLLEAEGDQLQRELAAWERLAPSVADAFAVVAVPLSGRALPRDDGGSDGGEDEAGDVRLGTLEAAERARLARELEPCTGLHGWRAPAGLLLDARGVLVAISQASAMRDAWELWARELAR